MKAFIFSFIVLLWERGLIILITPYDIPASTLIEKIANYLRKNVDEVTAPQWAYIVKTGVQAQRQPENPDWWYVRCASILRKIFIHGPLGVEKLRSQYGGRKDYGCKPEHAVKSGGAIIRKSIQQLEAAGFVETLGIRGRIATQKGRRLLQELAEEGYKEIIKENPDLQKYQKDV